MASSPLLAALDRKPTKTKDKEEAAYLASLQRRLGYTEDEVVETQIVETVTEEVPVVEVAPEPEPEVIEAPKPEHSVVMDDDGAPRLIELEYGGAAPLGEFEPVRAAPRDPPAATEYEILDEEEEAFEPIRDNEFVLLEPDDVIVEFTETPDEELVEFTEDDGLDEWEPADDQAFEPATEPEAPAEPAPEPGAKHGPFTLYRRELDGGQFVYFYSKKAPSDAAPAAIPDGYETREGDDNGLPYLARAA